MTVETFDDLVLMAYADGECDPDTAAKLDRAVESDAQLALRLRRFVDSRRVVKAAMDATLVPVPDALRDAVQQMSARPAADNVIGLADRRGRIVVAAAIAAGIALALGLGTGWFVGRNAPVSPIHIAALGDPGVIAALDTLSAGDVRPLGNGGSVTAIASFRDGDGALCREVEHDRPETGTLVAVACRVDGAWSVRLAIAAGLADGYAPASSLETLDAWLLATGAGQPLSAEDEAAALANGE